MDFLAQSSSGSLKSTMTSSVKTPTQNNNGPLDTKTNTLTSSSQSASMFSKPITAEKPLPFSSAKPLSELFKAASGWSCPTCMVQNEDKHDKCPCCETPNPSAPASKSLSSASDDSKAEKKLPVSSLSSPPSSQVLEFSFSYLP